MPNIVLGVHDLPHLGGKSVGDVAEILEDKYHVMETFVELYEDRIVETLVDSYTSALMDVINGTPSPNPGLSAASGAASTIERMFKQAVGHRELDGLIPGVPTQASIAGRSKRFKRGYNPRGSRPSFIDTWLYVSSFVVWVDDG